MEHKKTDVTTKKIIGDGEYFIGDGEYFIGDGEYFIGDGEYLPLLYNMHESQ